MKRDNTPNVHARMPPSKKSTPVAPNGPPCPKCGTHKDWDGPSYQKGKRVMVLRAVRPNSFTTDKVETVESLQWRCTVCGYVRHEVCKDNS